MTRIIGLIGLCTRARKLVSGSQLCDLQIRKGTAFLILMDEGASPNTQKAFEDACSYYNVPLQRMPEGALGQAIGGSGRMVAAVTDKALAERLLQLFTNIT